MKEILFLVVLANVACVCILLSQAVLMFPTINGSVSTHTKAKIGGLEGDRPETNCPVGIKAFTRTK